jgi:hypothetical protein
MRIKQSPFLEANLRLKWNWHWHQGLETRAEIFSNSTNSPMKGLFLMQKAKKTAHGILSPFCYLWFMTAAIDY